jgi:hypothetical protein
VVKARGLVVAADGLGGGGTMQTWVGVGVGPVGDLQVAGGGEADWSPGTANEC